MGLGGGGASAPTSTRHTSGSNTPRPVRACGPPSQPLHPNPVRSAAGAEQSKQGVACSILNLRFADHELTLLYTGRVQSGAKVAVGPFL